MKKTQFTEFIKAFDFKDLFNQLGWDNFNNQLPVAINEEAFMLQGIAEKKGFVIILCPPLSNGKIPLSNIRKQIESKVANHYFEHLIIYSDRDKKQQIWQLAIKEENKPKQVREVSWYTHQDVEALFQRMKNLLFTLDEEEKITIVDVKQRISENFARNTDQVTKKFYDQFKKQHTIFLDFIDGIDEHISDKENLNKQWYASLMLNRLMFCYFIQKKGFLDQDIHYLQNKLGACSDKSGKNNFYSFYRSFLLELFHDGLGKPEKKRKQKLPVDLGKIPYLNGGLFDVHELEHQFSQINIADEAFKKIFDFFDQWNWHLDNSIEATGRDINPDVIGYIFEKYINDRAEMGAYYTKEDITDYIGKNTIIPFLFDETARNCKEPFKSNGEIWSYIKNSGDDYIFDAVKYGIPKNGNILSDLPKEIKEGFNDNLEKQLVNAVSKSHLWEIRKTWNQPAPQDIALPTELYRELIDRRKRYNEINTKITNGEIKSINDFISYNINIRQFTQDFIESTPDANFVEHFYKAINKITILDPTCGSGAFLFAALNILEPMYEACIIRMEQFTSEQPAKYKFFEKTLEDVKSEKHPNLQYYIYKSIILNNLYGVDIMKEAVEIAKLRLFLKLVACVDVNPRKENFGLEPLPDVDFNIRSGNTLIGFATEKEMLETIRKTEPMFAEAKVEDFKEEFELVGKAFSHFQNNQLINDQGSDSFKKAKADLSARLKELNQKLNEYLSSNYGITDLEKNVEIEITTDKGKKAKKKINQFQYWLSTHKPFHWFAEFYKIVAADGGFDVIIGNPPYVVYTEEKSEYILKDYTTLSCSNLYAYCTERSFSLLHSRGKFGFIIPNSSISAGKLSPLQAILKTNKSSWISNYSWRPGKLFDGANMLLAIIISDCNTKDQLYSSQYYKWYNDYRPDLFQNISYTSVLDFIIEGSIPKVPNEFAKRLLQKTNSSSFNIEYFKSNSATRNMIYYFRAVLYWVKILDKIPVFKEDGVNKVTGEMKPLYFDSSEKKYVFGGLLSSSLFFLNYIVWSSCQVINSRDFDLKFDFNKLSSPAKKKLVQLGEELQSDFQENSKIVIRNYSTKGREFQMKKQYFYIKKSKNIIDQIDTVLAEYYGFTEEELDFIINYDIKYRMKILLSDADIEEDEED